MVDVSCFPKAHEELITQLLTCYRELFEHHGHGKMSVEMRFLKRGQKEVLITCGRQYRFTVDCCEGCATGIPCEKSQKEKKNENIG